MADAALPAGQLINPLSGALILVGALGALWFVSSEMRAGDEVDAQQMVAERLFDPASAEFRNVQVNGRHVCGEVNTKDRHGSYRGFKRFYVVGSNVTLTQRMTVGRSVRCRPELALSRSRGRRTAISTYRPRQQIREQGLGAAQAFAERRLN